MKAAGNIGVKEIFPYLEPYIEGRDNYHLMYRENALWSLRNVAHRYPDRVSSQRFLKSLKIISKLGYNETLSANTKSKAKIFCIKEKNSSLKF